MKILTVMNYKSKKGGLVVEAEQLIASLKKEGLSVEAISTYGNIFKRLTAIYRIFKIAPQYDIIMAAGCAYWGFMPIVVAALAAASCNEAPCSKLQGILKAKFLRSRIPPNSASPRKGAWPQRGFTPFSKQSPVGLRRSSSSAFIPASCGVFGEEE